MSDVLSARAARAVRMLGTYTDEEIERGCQRLKYQQILTVDHLLDVLQARMESRIQRDDASSRINADDVPERNGRVPSACSMRTNYRVDPTVIEELRNDVTDLLVKIWEDPSFPTNAIAEIDKLRSSFDIQRPLLSRVTTLCLLYLPVRIKLTSNRPERSEQTVMNNYLDKLHKILRRFSKLLQHLHGGETGQQAFAQGVEDVIRILQQERICLKHQHVLGLLKVIGSVLECPFEPIISGMSFEHYAQTPDESLHFDDSPVFEEVRNQQQQEQLEQPIQPQVEHRQQQQLEQELQPHNHAVEPAFNMGGLELGAVDGPAEIVHFVEELDGNAINGVTNNNQIAHHMIPLAMKLCSRFPATATETDFRDITLRYELLRLVSESEAHGNETQDGNEHRLSGLQDIISPGARNVAQGMSDVLSVRAARAVRMLGTYTDEEIERACQQINSRQQNLTVDCLLDALQKHTIKEDYFKPLAGSEIHSDSRSDRSRIGADTLQGSSSRRLPASSTRTRDRSDATSDPRLQGSSTLLQSNTRQESEESESDTDGETPVNEELYKNVLQTSNYKMTKGELKKLKSLNERVKRKRLCRKCSSKTANVLLLPCRHVPSCHMCIAAMETCPEIGCGMKFQAKVNVFWP